MKKKIHLIFLLSLLVSPCMQAYDFEADGICYNYIPGTNDVEVTYRDESYYSYSGNVIIPGTVVHSGITYRVTKIGKKAFYNPPHPAGSMLNDIQAEYYGLISVLLPKGITDIGEMAFSGCIGLISVNIPDGVRNIGNEAFDGCFGLISIFIPNTVTDIGIAAFSYCINLTSMSIPTSVTCIKEETFDGCSGLESISLPDSLKSIGHSAFSGCSELKSISLPKNLTSIEASTFYDCHKLESIILPNSVTDIGVGAFSHCIGLKSIYLPPTIRDIGRSAFFRCFKLVSISLPDSIKTIKQSTFSDCEGLTSIIIPDGVTTIEMQAFLNCYSLANICIPSSVNDIQRFAFRRCRIKRVEVMRDIPPVAYHISFDQVQLSQCTLFVPTGSRSTYENNGFWQSFGIISDTYLYSFANDISFDAVERTDSIVIRSNIQWTASCDVDWITLFSGSGNGSEMLKFRASSNETDETRLAYIRISGDGVDPLVIQLSQKSQITSVKETVKDDIHVLFNGNILSVETSVAERIEIYSAIGRLLYIGGKRPGREDLITGLFRERILIVKGSSGWVRKIMISE